MKDMSNKVFEDMEKEGLIVLICDCGYKTTKSVELVKHQESCTETGFDIYLGYRREE